MSLGNKNQSKTKRTLRSQKQVKGSQEVEKKPDLSQLFAGKDGHPMKFSILKDVSNRAELEDKISKHGGIVVTDKVAETGGELVINLSNVSRSGSDKTYRVGFVEDSILTGELKNLKPYKNRAGGYDASGSGSGGVVFSFAQLLKKSKRSKNFFSEEEDEYILKQVRLNPRLRTSHRFFNDLARHEVLREHTGESIRFRYRTRLEPRLTYVYKTTEDGALIRNADGKIVRENLEHLPKTLRTRFTALEDYTLSKEIVEFCKTMYLERLEKGTVDKNEDGSFKDFDPYGDLTVPLTFFATMASKFPSRTFNSWRDRFRKFVRPYGAQKYIDDYNISIKEGKLPERMSNFAAKRPDITRNFKELLGGNQSGNDNNEDSAALDEEISELKSSNIDTAITNATDKEILSDPIDSEEDNGKPFSQGGTQDDIVIDVNYAPPSVSYESLFNDNFYKIKPGQIIQEVEKVLNRCQNYDLQYLFKSFNKIGITDVFTAHILMATSADVAKIQVFINKFLTLFPFLKEDEIYQGLNIEDTDGLWSPLLDALLTSGSKHNSWKLLQVHSPESIENRKKFLEKLSQL